MQYIPRTNEGPRLIALLRERLSQETGIIQRGALSRIAEHLGTSKSAVHEWFKRGRKCNQKYHAEILHLIHIDHDFSAKKAGRKVGIKK
jgi:IS30 family transposase